MNSNVILCLTLDLSYDDLKKATSKLKNNKQKDGMAYQTKFSGTRCYVSVFKSGIFLIITCPKGLNKICPETAEASYLLLVNCIHLYRVYYIWS